MARSLSWPATVPAIRRGTVPLLMAGTGPAMTGRRIGNGT
jgi:hypothetical protein